jgi:coenzyme F420-reducing hydrogenase delta subunit
MNKTLRKLMEEKPIWMAFWDVNGRRVTKYFHSAEEAEKFSEMANALLEALEISNVRVFTGVDRYSTIKNIFKKK